jgi:N6-L-threonylcarbamoyladenine synthase
VIILGIETSCDETAAAICRDGREKLSNIVLSQTNTHALYGGVVPEIASRMHIESISNIVEQAMTRAGITCNDIDAVAATFAPGLIGALLVGLNFAKSAAFALKKPFIPVHHIRSHIAANYLSHPMLVPPFSCMVASGGHTLFLHVENYTKMKVLGSTRDDAAGEAFDKVARVLGLGYPGGRAVDELASLGVKDEYILPRPTFSDAPFDCSFSGLKTAVINIVHHAQQKNESIHLPALAASFNSAVTDILVSRLLLAERLNHTGKLVISGGVAANKLLRKTLEKEAALAGLNLYMPPPDLCGDNGAMVAAQGYFEFIDGRFGRPGQNAYATLGIDYGNG